MGTIVVTLVSLLVRSFVRSNLLGKEALRESNKSTLIYIYIYIYIYLDTTLAKKSKLMEWT
jgi:hypothetical protein